MALLSFVSSLDSGRARKNGHVLMAGLCRLLDDAWDERTCPGSLLVSVMSVVNFDKSPNKNSPTVLCYTELPNLDSICFGHCKPPRVIEIKLTLECHSESISQRCDQRFVTGRQ